MLQPKEQEEKNSVIDKREFQLQREARKTISIVIISMIIFLIFFMVITTFHKEIKNIYLFKTEKLQKSPVLSVNGIVADSEGTITLPTHKKSNINYNGLCVVHKVSKDYRKYFMTYRMYTNEHEYIIKIEQITFYQFMVTKENDTIKPIQSNR